jgi:hypothetical protein
MSLIKSEYNYRKNDVAHLAQKFYFILYTRKVSHPTINKNGDDSLKDPIHERFHVVLEEVVDEHAHY